MKHISRGVWIGGAVGVAMILGAVAYGFFMHEAEFVPEPESNEEDFFAEEIACVTSNTVVFEDPSLELAVKEQLYADQEQQQGPVFCDDLATLESLEAPGRGIFSLSGLEHASALQYLNLADNATLVNTDALLSLDKLTYLNLNGTNISDRSPFLTDVVWPALTELYIADNGLRDISWLNQMPVLEILALQNNAIADIEILFDQHALSSLFLYNNPFDLSVDSEERNVIETLQERSVDVVWDELALTLGVDDVANRRKTVEAPATVQLVARPSTSEIDPPLEIKAVEFFEVTDNGVLSSLGMDDSAPYSMDISFNEQHIGKTFQYAAEVITTFGATYLLVPNQYVSVTVNKAPECRRDADCADADQCTQDRCVEGRCQQQAIPACADTEMSCDDGIDNDRDGEADCNDNECFDNSACAADEPPPVEACNVENVILSCYMSTTAGKICTLSVSNGQCPVRVARCDSTGCYYNGTSQPFDWAGCSLEQTLQELQPGQSKELSPQYCAGLNLCKRIILCAE